MKEDGAETAGAPPNDDAVRSEPPALEAPDASETGLLDNFYQGIIERVNWGHENGVVRSGNGREIPFDFAFVTVVGEQRRVESLRAGMRVGFDVGWTSRGLRVTTLKVYD